MLKNLVFKKRFPEIKKIPPLLKAKEIYQKNQSILDVIDTPVKPGWGLSNYYAMKDVMFIATAGAGGALAGGIGGVVAGAAASAGAIAYVKSTGARLLHTAKFFDKAHKTLKNIKTPQKLANLINIPKKNFSEITGHRPISFSTLSFLMFGKDM